MSGYLIEAYSGRVSAEEARQAATRVRRAATAMRRRGVPIRHVRSIFLPEDEMWFHLFEAGSAEEVGELASRARLAYDRITRAEIQLGSQQREET